MTVGSVLRTKDGQVFTLSSTAMVGEAVTLLNRRRIGAAPVLIEDAVVGVFSERDIVHGLHENGANVLALRVSDLMTTPAVTVTCDLPVLGALNLMTERRIRHLPVVEHGKLIGLISIGDLVKYRIAMIEAEASSLRDYIQST